MKKIIRLTEGELTNLIKRILKEDSTTKNCIKEYKSPYPTDPYEYRINEECLWETRSDKSKKQTGKLIPDWISLYKNEKANEKLDKWFPNAKSDCSKCNKKTPISTDCPKKIDCLPGVGVAPKICSDDKALARCKEQGSTIVYSDYENVEKLKKKTVENKCPKTINCMPSPDGKTNICNDFFISYCIRTGKTNASY